MRNPAFGICENKDADQLRGNSEADQPLCLRHMDSAIPLLPKSEISSLQPSSMAVQTGLCRTWSETPKTGFLTTRLIYDMTSVTISLIHMRNNKGSDQTVQVNVHPYYSCSHPQESQVDGLV